MLFSESIWDDPLAAAVFGSYFLSLFLVSFIPEFYILFILLKKAKIRLLYVWIISFVVSFILSILAYNFVWRSNTAVSAKFIDKLGTDADFKIVFLFVAIEILIVGIHYFYTHRK